MTIKLSIVRRFLINGSLILKSKCYKAKTAKTLVRIFVAMLLMASSTAIAQTTWYSLASGKWTDHQIWTLDPAGAVRVNPSSLYPNLTTDNIVIRTGITVAIPDGLIPYDSPLETKNNLDCGTLTVNGDLDFGVSTGHKFTEIKGNGRLYFESNNFPTSNWTHFVTAGQGGGTIVLKGITNFAVSNLPASIYDLEINNSDKTKIYTLGQDLTITGNLTIESGVFQIGNSTTVRNLTVNGNVNVKADGQLTTGTTGSAVFHWMNVSGNFTNSGVVDFSNSAQYTQATTGAVKLKFLGTSDNNLVCNNTTDLYRLFVDKGSDQTYTLSVNANSSANFKLFGPVSGTTNDATDGAAGWQRLPIVLVNGTLKLESNIVIAKIGEDRNGSAPNEFTIPSSAQLWISGASFTSSTTTGAWRGITVYGKLSIDAGTITTPALTNGIYFATDGVVTPVIEINGGTINTTQIRPYSSSSKFQYIQSGGVLNFNARATDYWSNSLLYLPDATHVFEMSGGEINFSVANTHNVSGVYINSDLGNYNVTGGTVTVLTPSTNEFRICTTAPFYNLTVNGNGNGPTRFVEQTNQYGLDNAFHYGALSVLNNLTITNNGKLDGQVYNLSVGGNMTIDAGSIFIQDAGTSAKLIFNGAKNSVLTNQNATALTLGDVEIDKEMFAPSSQFYTVSLAGSTGGITINDSLRIVRGKFDVVNYNINLKKNLEIVDGDLTSSGTGAIILSGTAQQTIKGAAGIEQNFGRLQLNNTASSPQIKLLSNINATSVEFIAASQVLDLGIYNLDISSSNYSSWGWSTTSNRYFLTNGLASDGGLTLPITAGTYSDALIQLFPMATAGGYSPVAVYGTTTLVAGSVKVIPVNGYHPTVSDVNKVSQYYWKINHSISGADGTKLRYKMYLPVSIKSSYNALLVLNSYIWNNDSGSENVKVLTYNPTYISTNKVTGDYTVGNQSAFNSPRILYSIISGDFSNKNTWSETSHTGSATNKVPSASDFLIIGGAAGVNHTVTINSNNNVGSQVYIKGISETGISGTPPTLKVASGKTGQNIDIIDGKGRLVYETNQTYESSYPLITGDHSSLCNNSEAIVEFTGTQNQIRNLPTNAQIPFYPNLVLSSTTGTDKFPWNDNLVVKGNLTLGGSTLDLKGLSSGSSSVAGNVTIGNGTLKYFEGYNHTLTVNGNIVFSGNGTLTGSSTGGERGLYLYGNIQLGNGNLQLASSTQKVNIIFLGDNDATVSRSGTGNTNFYRTYINKSEGKKVEFTTSFALNGPSDDVSKSLVLQSGICHLNNSAINITLSTNNNPFKIPSGTTLRVDNGATVKVGSGSNTTGIWLDGALIIDNGGKVYCNQGAVGANNYLEYTASGASSIWLGTNAELLVGSQLRRTTTSDGGILQFTQSKASSVVTIGSLIAPTGNRGVFEILNNGSSFIQSETGCNITLVRAQTAASKPALLFNPETATIATGSSFTLGNGSTPASQNLGIYAGQPLMNLTIGSTNSPTVTVSTEALTVNGNLTNGGTLNAGGYDLYLNGNFINNGTYVSGSKTTYFGGASSQDISGSATTTSFYNLTKQGSNTLNFAGTTAVAVTNDLSILGGTLNTNAFDLNITRNIYCDGTVLSSGASKGVVCSGTSLQQLSGAATFARFTVNNASGVDVPTQGAPINITDYLELTNGVLNIGSNLIVFDNDATITATGGFSTSKMIQTNLSFTDNGIKRFLPAGAGTYLFPIGSAGKYTPITLTVTANGNITGAIRVKALNEKHITISDNTSTAFDDTKNVLQYNWTLDASGISGFTGTAKMAFVPTDALVTAGNDTSSYITARILLNSTDWNKFDVTGFKGNPYNELLFAFTGVDDGGIDGDYTAGLNASLPDQVPSYISKVDGAWTTASTWAVYNPTTWVSGAAGVGVPAGGPNGAIVYLDHTVTTPINFLAAYRTNINATGVLSTGSSFGHRLGDVSGTGTILLQSGSLPSGVYLNFFSASGGTVEYSGSTDYSILSEVTSLNNLKLSGTGQRNLPNIPFSVLGTFTLAGGACENPHNTNFSVKGNLVYNGGTFDVNTATVTFDGTARQTISGSSHFTSPNKFHNFVMNNALGMDVVNNIEVSNVLTLTNGIINTGAGGSLTITNGLPEGFTGGSVASYVDGPLRKQVNNNSDFTFPVGDNTRYGMLNVATNGTSQGLWEVEYYNHNPGDDGYNPATVTGSVAYVSHNEYWRVKAPAAGYSANLTMNWDSNSGVVPDANFKVVKWTDLATDAWSEVAIGAPTGTASSGSVSLASVLAFGFNGSNNNHYLTFGSITIPAYTWSGGTSTDWFVASNWSGTTVPSAGSNITINNVTNDPVIGEGTLAQANNITMGSGAVLTLNPGARLTVNGNITNTGATILIKNTIAKPTSFMTYGTLSAAVTSEWVYPTRRFIYIGHCVDGRTFADYTAKDPAVNMYRFTSGAWSQITSGAYSFDANKIEGYSVGFNGVPDVTMTLTGALRTASYGPMAINNWHLIGNPYSTYLDLENAGFILGTNALKTVWTTNSGTGTAAYATYNIETQVGANGGTRYVAPGQSFWVRTYVASTLTINNTVRTHATGALKGASMVDDVLRLTVSRNNIVDESVLVFRAIGSEGYSSVYDSEKRFSTGATEVSLFTQKDSKSLIINALPETIEDRIVPLYLNVGAQSAGNLTINATNLVSFMSDVDVFLVDKVAGTTINLREQPTYAFTSAAGNGINRFDLKFATSTPIDEVPTDIKTESVDDIVISAYAKGNKAVVSVVDSEFKGKVTIDIYDVVGRLQQNVISKSEKTEINLSDDTQLYTIKVTYKNRVKTIKLVGFID